MKSKFVYLAVFYLATVALMASGTALAQSRALQSAIDSYSAGLAECQCASGHPDTNGKLGVVKEYERVKAWRPANTVFDMVRTMPETTRPGAMSANEGSNLKDNGSRPGDDPASAK